MDIRVRICEKSKPVRDICRKTVLSQAGRRGRPAAIDVAWEQSTAFAP